jgi:hypothetical protein
VQILHDIINCEEAASECLPYASTVPNMVQIHVFLNSKDWHWKCVCLKFESAEFLNIYFWQGNNGNILLAKS